MGGVDTKVGLISGGAVLGQRRVVVCHRGWIRVGRRPGGRRFA